MSSSAPPPWLEEHCSRLLANDDELQNLNLNLRRLNLEWMQYLAAGLEGNTNLQVLNLVNSITTLHAETTIAFVLSRTRLQRLHLSYNRMDDVGAMSYGRALSHGTTLRELYLDFNDIGPEGAVALVDGLTTRGDSQQVQVLNLDCNHIGNLGAAAFGELLKSNTSLRILGLGRNDIDFEGAMALLRPLQEGTNLTLTKMNLNGNDIMDDSVVSKINFYLSANKFGRYLLRQETSSSKHNIPVGLWPHVLGRVKNQPDLIYFFLSSKPDLCKND